MLSLRLSVATLHIWPHLHTSSALLCTLFPQHTTCTNFKILPESYKKCSVNRPNMQICHKEMRAVYFHLIFALHQFKSSWLDKIVIYHSDILSTCHYGCAQLDFDILFISLSCSLMHEIISMQIMPADGQDPKLSFQDKKSYLYRQLKI